MSNTYEVILQDSKTAIIEQTDRDDARTFLFFYIQLSTEGNIENEGGTFLFKPLSHFGTAHGDPRGYESIGSNFHGKRAIERTIEASSLQEACTKFFSEWGDKFKLTGHLTENA